MKQLAKQLSGAGLQAINATLKAAQKQHAAQQAQAARARHAALRVDPRPLIRAPFPSDPWLPQMGVLNEVIGAVVADMPPVRNIDADATRVRKLPVANMHAFIDANEPEGGRRMTRLTPPERWMFTRDTRLEAASIRSTVTMRRFPDQAVHADRRRACTLHRRHDQKETTNDQATAPEQWVLSTMNEMEVAEMIEQHIEHYVEDKDGNRCPCIIRRRSCGTT